MKPIYLDYAATTPVDSDALRQASKYFKTDFFNPSSVHAQGRSASYAVERARERCAAAINAKNAGEIYFTSSGTEAVNQALKCVATDGKKRNIVISAIEHDSALGCTRYLERAGFSVRTVMPNAGGVITPDALRGALDDDTALVCVMTVNNVTGAVQPVSELAAAAHERGALFFTDAVQAVNSVELDVQKSNVDMLAASAHKFYGMKGAGFLYVKRGVDIEPLIDGGAQEREKRAGTVNVPAVVAMGAAIEKACRIREEYNAHIFDVSRAFTGALDCGRPVACDGKINDITSIVFDGVNGGRLAVALSLAGVSCSVGSACSAGSAVVPPALVAMNVKNADCAVRFSFGRDTTAEQAAKAAFIVNRTVKKLL